MDTDTTLSEKVAFFDDLDALNGLSDEGKDAFDSDEQEFRKKFKVVFASSTSSKTTSQSTAPLPPLKRPGPSQNLRRTFSAPTPAPKSRSAIIIEATPDARNSAAAANTTAMDPTSDSPVVKETPAVPSPRPSALLQRSATVPLPLPRQLSLPDEKGDQPPSATMKKRKRGSSAKTVPVSEQILKGVSIYWIPNDDIAPMRKLRIKKAQEYGGHWVRGIASATHVVVDNRLEYKDVEKVLKSASGVVVVNEDYILDCITYRALLNSSQQRYKVSGFPIATENPEPAPASQSNDSEWSLQLKEAPKMRRKRDLVPQTGTPPAEESPQPESSGDLDNLSTNSGTADPVDIVNYPPQSSSPVEQPDPGEQGEPFIPSLDPSHPNSAAPDIQDELSDYIKLMLEYKDLPLDGDDDDDDDDQSSKDNQSVTYISDSESDPGSEDERAKKKPHSKPANTRKGKNIAFEDRFACNRGGTLASKSASQDANPNAPTIQVLQQLCDYYTRVNDHWRTTAYRKAIATLRRQPTKIRTEDEAFLLPNIGRRIAAKIEEIVSTSALRRLTYATSDPLDRSLALFLGIYGVGPPTAHRWLAQGHRTLSDLLASPPPDMTPHQRLGLHHHADLNTRIPRAEAAAIAALVRAEAAALDPAAELLLGGSYRRGAPSSGDIDLIVTRRGTASADELVPLLEDLVRALERKGVLVATLAEGGSKWHGCCVLPDEEYVAAFGREAPRERPVWRRIDFLLVPEAEYGAALIYFTGNDIFNRSLRLLASKKGMRLNQRGLYREVMRGRNRVKVTEGELVEGRDERRIFEILGVKWREPGERWC
ncbi:hypothetical protein B0T18DRAFT_325144 [Schizothecium vesticola]|uniref:DNA polymerase lambda n=1 Tax=Schizothecium vesticola TaxID=314040 RepID=A0AA40K516_9PEZI|nr:hypothetical protein B0T18DRAFT_325144 [Schizothecium vesticola]